MAKVLILFAHPLLEKSRVHRALIQHAQQVPEVTINDLYENYPDFDIDVEKEKALLKSHDVIIWQHPFYWYSAPPLLKQWQDIVLEHGWAYGTKGHALSGKRIFNAITTGGSMEAYQSGGYNKYAIHDFLKPFEQTAELCRMVYWPPYWIPGVHRMEMADIERCGRHFGAVLNSINNEIFSEKEILNQALLNNLFPITSTEF